MIIINAIFLILALLFGTLLNKIDKLKNNLKLTIEELEIWEDITQCYCHMDINTKWIECDDHKRLKIILNKINGN